LSDAGRRTGDVEVVRVIGQGSMGEVCYARDPELLRDVAFKRLKRGDPEASQLAKALEREARIAAQLDHPNIVPIHRMQRGDDGELGYVMKLVQGETLHQLLARAVARSPADRQPDERQGARLEVLIRVIDAVAYAHDKGVVHRDLKPANVLIAQRGQVYLTDWGLARVLKKRGPLADLSTVQIQRAASADPTEASALLGTLRYMSPEQANGRTQGLGPESDVFALGLMLIELLTLKHPYPEVDAQSMAQRVRSGRLRIRGGDAADDELLDIARRATATRPEDRYPDAGDLADDLARWRRGERTVAARNTVRQRVRRILRRRPDLGVVSVVGLLAADLAVLAALWLRG